MIQITQWIDPDDRTWCNKRKRFISTDIWLNDEALRIEKKKNCSVEIKTDSDGNQAIFREKLR